MRPSRVHTLKACVQFPFRHFLLCTALNSCDYYHPALPDCPTDWRSIMLKPFGRILC